LPARFVAGHGPATCRAIPFVFDNQAMSDPAQKNPSGNKIYPPDRKPNFICSDCNIACFIEEHGYAGGVDDEPIACQKCGRPLGTFHTSGHTRKIWKQL
jgi:hypothetical protein